MAGFIGGNKRAPKLGSKSGGFESATTPHESDRIQPAASRTESVNETLDNIDSAIDQSEASSTSNVAPASTSSSSDLSKGAERYQNNVQARSNPPVQRAQTKRAISDIDPAKDYGESAFLRNSGGTGGRLGKLASTVQGIIQRNPRKILGGGIAGILLAGILMIFSPLMAEFKLSMFMENLYKQGFRYVTHNYVERQRLILRYYLKEHLDPTFDPNSAIVNYDRSMIKDLYGRLRGDERLKKKLEEAGYKITVKSDPNYAGGRIIRIEREGQILTAENFEATYDLVMERGPASTHVSQIAEEVFSGKGMFSRLEQRRLAIITGVKFHWLDAITEPFQKTRIRIRNQVITFILEKSPIAQRAAAAMLAFLTGQKIDADTSQKVAEEVSSEIVGKAATEELTEKVVGELTAKGMAQALTKVVGDVSNPAGWIILAIAISCVGNEFFDSGYDQLQQIAKDKATAEYIVQFIALHSSLSQLHEGKTDANAIGALMELLNDSNGRDYSFSNNYKRATGEDIPYKATEDCESGVELCQSKRPDTMIDGVLIGMKQYQDKVNGEWQWMPGMPGNNYGDAICGAIMPVLNFVDGIIYKAFEILLKTIPGVEAGFKWLSEKGGQFIINYLINPMLRWLLPPVIDASTRGPHLANAAAAGALGAASTFMRSFCGNPTYNDPEAAKQCRLTGADLMASETAIREQIALEQQSLSLWERIASLSNPRSVLSRTVASLPSNPQTFLARLTTIPQFVASLRIAPVLANAGSLAAPTAWAADPNYVEPTGVDVYAYTDKQVKTTKLNAGENDPGGVKGMDAFDTTVACGILGGLSKGENMPEGCDPDALAGYQGGSTSGGDGPINPADMCKVGPGGAQLSQLDCAAYWAEKLLNNPNITNMNRKYWEPDLRRAMNRQPTHNSDTCYKDAYLHPALLFALNQTASQGNFKIGIYNIISGHGCDQFLHPLGRASDIGSINGVSTDVENGRPGTYNRAFSEYIAKLLPDGGEILQANKCYTATLPRYIIDGADRCNHIHVSAGSKIK